MIHLGMLKTTLQIVEFLNDGPQSSAVLEARYGIGVATLKRHIAEARHLGADIVSRRDGKGWKFHLQNGPAVITLCRRWLELEHARTLVS